MQIRDKWVDFAKGIGILLVVYGHVSRGLFNASIPMNAELFRLIDSVIYSFHMPLFFFLAGLFYLPSRRKYGGPGLVIEKLDSIIYPYIVWSLLQGLTEVAMSQFTNGHTTIYDVLSFPWRPRAQFWFLHSLFIVFVLTTLLYRPSKPWSIWMIPILALLWWSAGFIVHIPIPFNPIFFIFFVLGAQVHAWRHLIQSSILTITLVSGVFFAAFQYAFHGPLDLLYSASSALVLPLAFSGIFFICCTSFLLAQINHSWITWISFIGRYSMPIYLVHILAGSGIRIILSKFLGINDFYLHLLLGVLTSVAVPIILYLCIQTRYLQSVRYFFQPPESLSFSHLRDTPFKK